MTDFQQTKVYSDVRANGISVASEVSQGENVSIATCATKFWRQGGRCFQVLDWLPGFIFLNWKLASCFEVFEI